MKTAGISLANIPVLETAEQWPSWSREIQDYLILSGYNHIIDNDTAPQEGDATQRTAAGIIFKEQTVRAAAAIRNRCGYNARDQIKDKDTVKAMLNALKAYFKPQGSGVFSELCRRFNDLALNNCKGVTEYTEQLRRVMTEMAELHPSLKLPEPFVVQKFLHGLGSGYEVFQTTFNQTHDIIPGDGDKTAITFNATSLAAINEERRIASEQNTSQMLVATRISGNKATIQVDYCGHCKKYYHTEDKCFLLHPELKKKKRSGKGKKEKAEKEQSEDEDGEDSHSSKKKKTMNLISTYHLSTSYNLADWWVIDSGCEQHMTNNKGNFVEFSSFPTNQHDCGGLGGITIPAQGRGTVKISIPLEKDEVDVMITNVLYCPGSGVNLLSLSQLLDKGVNIKWSKSKCTIEYQGLRIEARRAGGLFFLAPVEKSSLALVSYGLTDASLAYWHERTGHLGEQNLKKLFSMSTGMKDIHECVSCEPCILGRMHEKPHSHQIERATYQNECTHTDIAGPFQCTGYDGSVYWIIFLDDATQLSEVAPIRHKHQFLDKLKAYHKRNYHPARPFKRIHLDRAGENIAGVVKDWCISEGIHLEYTAPEQHQMNGAAERLNLTLEEKLLPTMISSDIPLKWWPVVLETINYLRIISPCTRLNKTPFEAAYGKVPDLSPLRILGSDAYALKTERKRPTLAAHKSIKCKLVGYNGRSMYKLITPDDKLITWSNVHIVERTPASLKRKLEVVGDSDAGNEGETKRTSLPMPELPQIGLSCGELQSQNENPSETRENSPSPSNSSRDNSPTRDETREYYRQNPGEITREVLRSHPELQQPLRVSTRENKGVNHHSLGYIQRKLVYLALIAAAKGVEPYEPQTLQDAQNDTYWSNWKQAIQEEYDSLLENGTWEVIDRPSQNVLSGKWVFRLKRGPDGRVCRWKARWVVRGFEQQEGIDYQETFASVVKPMSYKVLFAIAAAHDLEVEQMDVKTAFLYGEIKETVFVELPPGVDPSIDRKTKVCKLRKGLYGLKQSPSIWYKTLSDFLKSLGFRSLLADYSVFIKGDIIIAVYVDDLLILGSKKNEIQKVKEALSSRFQMKDLGPCQYYLGMKVTRDRANRILRLGQRTYAEKILRDFGMADCKPAATPMETSLNIIPAENGYEAPPEIKHWYQGAVGALMYLMLGTRPELAFPISVVSRYAANPTDNHVSAVKRILRYLKGTLNYELNFKGSTSPLVGYTDADWAGDKDTRRSTSGYTFNIGSGAISWSSKRQPTVALSTCEAEYMGQTQAVKEAIWLKGLLVELSDMHNNEISPSAVILYGDNQGAIALAKNPVFHGRTKHIDIQHHFVREKVESGDVSLEYIPTEQQIADGLTKPLPRDRFEAFRKALGVEQS
jgi:TfoX/Sxy family transcriptional regulator of competence genes